MKTLPLTLTEDGYWDLRLSSTNNLEAISGEAEYCAQTAANECRLFLNDSYLFPEEGIPYFEEILGKKPPDSLVQGYLRSSASNVPLVKNVLIRNFDRVSRKLAGTMRITTENGSVDDVSF